MSKHLSGIESPVKRRCPGCGRVFFAFSPLRITCFPKCPGKAGRAGPRTCVTKFVHAADHC